ncbi:MAG: sigma 54-interacting transcriptional regulator [Rhodospirillales bacterium]|jgi:DNA-binding NtrC family response regulator|nr:sigma 54-interacting transcriptional regulator [Rhodospirillales bacterium]
MAESRPDFAERFAALQSQFFGRLAERVDVLDALVDDLGRAKSVKATRAALGSMQEIGHKLAGSGGMFGAPTVSVVGRDLEEACERAMAAPGGRVDDAARRQLRDLVGRLRKELDSPLEAAPDMAPAVKPATPRGGSAAAHHKRRVVLIEDDLAQARMVATVLGDTDYEVVHFDKGRIGLEEIEKRPPDAILLDLMLPDIDGIDILRRVSSRQLPCVTVVVTAHGSVNVAVEAMRLGAYDFIVKPFNAARLQVTLRNALEHDRLSRILETYQDLDRPTYCGFIGSSLPMQAIYRIIDSAAGSKATVFISGESGTGKEVCAEAIHQKSPRAGKPFVALNCGAIPKDLMESEIFGHVKGAFTGAIAEREGAAKRADGGTLFLDEVCEMDLSLQTKLLRFVQTGTFLKVGGEATESVDVRFLCATNRDPLAEVAAGRFREDLFYRLHVIPVHMPPLRERGRDVPQIAQKYLESYAAEEGKRFVRFDPECEAVLAAYPWPGNVRELQNVIRNVVVLNDGDTVTVDMLPSPVKLLAGAERAAAPLSPAAPAEEIADDSILESAAPNLIRPLAEVEREAIERAIRICGGNIPKAAHFLGVSASTLYRKKQGWDDGRTAG